MAVHKVEKKASEAEKQSMEEEVVIEEKKFLHLPEVEKFLGLVTERVSETEIKLSKDYIEMFNITDENVKRFESFIAV